MRPITVAADASGAYEAARRGDIVLIVDVVDMGTTLEAALQAGAKLVLGAAPAGLKVPVPVNPRRIGKFAAEKAQEFETGVVVIAEPRVARDEERQLSAAEVLCGLREEGLRISKVYPNMGAETVKLVDFRDQVVVAVSANGGTAYDAAFNAGADVFTATVARTYGYTGWENAEFAVERVLKLASQKRGGITVVAASSKALEDVLAAHYLARALQRHFFRGV
ncbi:MAG: Uncharacterized protein XD63_0249 [Thermoanaerobacterales bacterium 50_218]|nr:MAG: Uncharacterized protein XD63_0249 [Thermoanaerobacterales bacterium 50_218]HAA90442.1 hypothetical protein [Peptococcaceae bacterium]